MKEFTLITGASSGIGLEMARQLAAKGFNLILAARSINQLEKIKAGLEDQYGITVFAIQTDLSLPANAIGLYEDIRAKNLSVSMLINNAGFGEYGNFIDLSLERQIDMINVNIASLTILCRLFLADMKKAGRGKVMNIASLLSYLPFPYYAVYSATKTYVLSFTETLAAEFEGTGIEIKALCPGPVATNFNSAEMLNTNAYKANKPISAVKVAAAGVNHLLNGKGSKKVGFNTWFISQLPRFTPDFIMMKIKKNLASQRKAQSKSRAAYLIWFLLANLLSIYASAQTMSAIHWPEKYEPAKSKFHVQNEIEIMASPEKVWQILIEAPNWRLFYRGAKNVQIVDSNEIYLTSQSAFNWQTMGQRFTSYIREYVPNQLMAWESIKKNIQGYHVWLIVPTATGCRLITEESQNGSLVFWEKLFQPKKLRRLHEDWLRGIKEKAEVH